jgi:hypothetical protein
VGAKWEKRKERRVNELKARKTTKHKTKRNKVTENKDKIKPKKYTPQRENVNNSKVTSCQSEDEKGASRSESYRPGMATIGQEAPVKDYGL